MINFEQYDIGIDGLSGVQIVSEAGNNLTFARVVEGVETFQDLSELMPTIVDGDITIYLTRTFSLLKNINYQVIGIYTNAPEDVKIYISKSNEGIVDEPFAIIEQLSEDGSFYYPGYGSYFSYQEDTEITVWTKVVLTSGVNQTFQVDCSSQQPVGYVAYTWKTDLDVPTKIDIDTPANEETNTPATYHDYSITAYMTNNLNLYNSFTARMKLFNYNSNNIPENYVSIEATTEQSIFLNNVIKGLYEQISVNNSNYITFAESLNNLIADTSVDVSPDTSNFTLTTGWGKQNANKGNAIIIWTALEENPGLDENGIQRTITFNQDAEPREENSSEAKDGVLDGINWYSNCLSKNTLMTMSNGTQKRFDQLEVGDKVLDKDNQEDIIIELRKNIFKPSYTKYYFSDGTIIEEVTEHRFYNKTQGFWQRLKQWKIGDAAINSKGEEVYLNKVVPIEETMELCAVFTKSGTFYANGLLSGAAWLNKELLPEASTEQAIDMMLSFDEKQLADLLGVKENIL